LCRGSVSALSPGFVPNAYRLALALSAAVMLVVPRAEAARLSLDRPQHVAPGWTRIAGHYDGAGGGEPVFRTVVRCAANDVEGHVLEGVVHVAPEEGSVWVDLPGAPEELLATNASCATPELSIEMRVGTQLVASASVSERELSTPGRADLLAAPTAPVGAPRRFHLQGQKYAAPLSRRTEAGVEWALDSHVSIQLNYERTAQAPMMPVDHDDGFLTRLRVSF
jgi:hypothetical protein